MRLNKVAVVCMTLVVVLAAACVGPPDRPHPRAGSLFRQRWWNHYRRGLEAAGARNYAAARADLTAALDLRARDQRMARTYGMHFIDYFPHRELGVVHWLEGELAAAEAQLVRSIEQEPSAKARFYLDRVRKALIRRKGADVGPPRLELSPGPLWRTAPRVTIRGRALDPNFVSSVRVAGEPLFMEGARSDFEFSHDLSLPQGCHTIAVEAVNLAGRTAERRTVICVDRLGPAVVLERIAPRADGVLISGAALDMAGVTELRINGRALPVAGETDAAFSHVLAQPPDVIRIQCGDRLGNRSQFLFDGRFLQSGRRCPRLVAGLHMAGLFHSRDDQPPKIRLQDWQAQQTVYLEKVVLSGSVQDPGTVASLSINGEPALPRQGPLVFFTHIVDLAPGPNTITLEARDAAGNLRTRTLSIERRIPKGLLLEERLRLAVFAFEQKGRISAAGFAFQDDFIHAMVQRRRFQLVERQRLDWLLREQKLNRSDLIDASTALHLGNLAAAQAVVAGSLVETRTGLEIVGRVMDSETGDILCTADVYGEIKTLPGLKTLAQALSLKLHREFPLVDGRVIDRRGNMILTDLTLDKLRAQRRLLIYTEHPVKHPDTGQDLGMDQEVLGAARVTQVDKGLSKARLQDDGFPEIKAPLRVITQ
jgi:hypothetical protein